MHSINLAFVGLVGLVSAAVAAPLGARTAIPNEKRLMCVEGTPNCGEGTIWGTAFHEDDPPLHRIDKRSEEKQGSLWKTGFQNDDPPLHRIDKRLMCVEGTPNCGEGTIWGTAFHEDDPPLHRIDKRLMCVEGTPNCGEGTIWGTGSQKDDPPLHRIDERSEEKRSAPGTEDFNPDDLVDFSGLSRDEICGFKGCGGTVDQVDFEPKE